MCLPRAQATASPQLKSVPFRMNCGCNAAQPLACFSVPVLRVATEGREIGRWGEGGSGGETAAGQRVEVLEGRAVGCDSPRAHVE